MSTVIGADRFGHTILSLGGGWYQRADQPGLTIQQDTDASAFASFNGMAPDGWAPPSAVPTSLPALDFIRRFTDAERATLMAANPVWGVMIAAAGSVDAASPELLADLTRAVALGALTVQRIAQILDFSQASP